MSKKTIGAMAALLLRIGFLEASVPSEADVATQILPQLLIMEIADLRMAEFDLSNPPAIVDFTVVDLSQWGEPNCSEMTFRVFFKATKDIYQRLFRGDDEENGFTMIRVGVAGRQYAIEFKCTVKSQTEPGIDGKMQTVYKFAKGPYRGNWAMENSKLMVGGELGSREAWEAIVAVTGESLRFLNSPNELE